jgi:hypothetical protein
VHRIAEVEDFQPVEKLIQKREKGISIPETQQARTTLMLLRNKNILYISYFDPLPEFSDVVVLHIKNY